MKHLFRAWDKVEKEFKKSGRVVVLSDYDGTLTPIVSRPELAKIPGRVKTLLKRLARKERFRIAVVSGRKLSDVKRLVGLSGIYYAGNHGLEIKGPGIDYLHPAFKPAAPRMREIKKKLILKTAAINGIIIEHKGASLSLHYRLVRDREIKRLRGIFKEVCAPYADKKKIRVTAGKKVLEVRPPVKWDKGYAAGKIVKVLAGGRKALPVFIGDDKTDEDAFRHFKGKKAVTILVGGKGKATSAGYYLNAPKEVEAFLERLCQV
jgi:trehalose-phosphatase